MGEAVKNLYVHFPFCRRKCTYCALFSKAGVTPAERASYVKRIAAAIRSLPNGDSPRSANGDSPPHTNGDSPLPSNGDSPRFATVYFGGGSPALCDLSELFDALQPLINKNTEFSVELHPLDVTPQTLQALKDGGVNRISMGLQSVNDEVLRHMGRGYTFSEAERSFYLIKEYFDNAGIDLIVGYPGEPRGLSPRHARLAKWGLRHCSAYSLILEEQSALYKLTQGGTVPLPQTGTVPRSVVPRSVPDDDELMNELSLISRFIEGIGLKRYEISNYCAPGYECRHNMATWAGEDYYGLGIGAHGRLGLKRTRNWWGQSPSVDAPGGQSPSVNPQGGQSPLIIGGQSPSVNIEGEQSPCSGQKAGGGQSPTGGALWGQSPEVETVSDEIDFKERRIFNLRTSRGLDTGDCPQWRGVLDGFVEEGLLKKENLVYRLTERGSEVCDSILAELL